MQKVSQQSFPKVAVFISNFIAQPVMRVLLLAALPDIWLGDKKGGPSKN